MTESDSSCQAILCTASALAVTTYISVHRYPAVLRGLVTSEVGRIQGLGLTVEGLRVTEWAYIQWDAVDMVLPGG